MKTLLMITSLVLWIGTSSLAQAQNDDRPLRCTSEDKEISDPSSWTNNDLLMQNDNLGDMYVPKYQATPKSMTVRKVTCTVWVDIVQLGQILGNRGNCELEFDIGGPYIKRRFGELISFYPTNCRLIEYSIVVDGRLRTFTVSN